VRWFGTDGKRYSKSFSTRKEADRFARQLQQKVLDGKQDKPKEITLGQFRQEHLRLMRGQVAYATLWDQDRALRLFENFIGSSVKLTQIKPSQAEAFVSERKLYRFICQAHTDQAQPGRGLCVRKAVFWSGSDNRE